MHAPLRNYLAVEVRQLLEQPYVLQQRWATRPRRLDVGVVDDGHACGMGHARLVIGHRSFLLLRLGLIGSQTTLRPPAMWRRQSGLPIEPRYGSGMLYHPRS